MISKRFKKLAACLALAGMLFTSGCWGLVLYGRPGPGRNQGKIDWGVVVLDVLLTPWALGLIIDAGAGTLRRPKYQESWSDKTVDERVEEYKRIGYTETDKPLVLRKGLRINVRNEDLRSGGDRSLQVSWRGLDGHDRALFSGTLRDAVGRTLPVTGCSGPGRLEVSFDGTVMAWDAGSSADTQFASR